MGRASFERPSWPPTISPAWGCRSAAPSNSRPRTQKPIRKARFAISTEETRYYLNGSTCTSSRPVRRPCAGGRDRWSSSCAGRDRSHERHRGHAWCDRAAQSGSGGDQAARRCSRSGGCLAQPCENPLRRWRRGAHLEADQRPLPGLCPRHPVRQQPGLGCRSRRTRQGRGPRLDVVLRKRVAR